LPPISTKKSGLARRSSAPSFQDELTAEKKKLSDQGLSSTALQSRIKVYEAERTTALDSQLADARKRQARKRPPPRDKIQASKG